MPGTKTPTMHHVACGYLACSNISPKLVNREIELGIQKKKNILIVTSKVVK